MVSAPVGGGDGATEIRSPLLNSVRYWFYNKPTSTYNICSPYIYLSCGLTTSEWKFDVTFNHYGGGSEVIKFGISNLQIYVTP
jgi:hypothetical protein